MTTRSSTRTSHSTAVPRAVPPVLDAPKANEPATVLLVEPDPQRRERLSAALEDLPLRILFATTPDTALGIAAGRTISALLIDASDRTEEALDLLRRMRFARPQLSVLVWEPEGDAAPLSLAVNQVGILRVVARTANDAELRGAVLAAVSVEREIATLARLDRPWMRGLLRQIEEVIPPALLAELDEKGGPLPFDLVRRPSKLRAESSAP